MPGSWPEAEFPDLNEQNHEVTSPSTNEYNCIAWAAGDQEAWWWPDSPDVGYSYWPPNVPRTATVLAFLLAYSTLGYARCEDGSLEQGFEKIALYVGVDEIPTHAARQLPDGRWTSKLGGFEDITHTSVECLHGDSYGRVSVYLKRPV
jgi:hypothetical protein